jgi:uncharacterized membrane protein
VESKAKFLGHPIHPVLIVFPLGLLATAAIFDIIAFLRGTSSLFTASFWMIAAGIPSGVIASVFGLIDWLAIPAGTRAKGIGLWHGVGNGFVIFLFAVSWVLRRQVSDHPSWIALTFSWVAVMIAFVTAWLGGELVDRLGVGVDDGANLNAPNSMSGRIAKQDDPHARVRRVA